MILTVIPIVIGAWSSKVCKEAWKNWKSEDESRNNSIVTIGQNTEKSPGDLRRLAVSQTPLKDHQQTLVCKTRKK